MLLSWVWKKALCLLRAFGSEYLCEIYFLFLAQTLIYTCSLLLPGIAGIAVFPFGQIHKAIPADQFFRGKLIFRLLAEYNYYPSVEAALL